MTYCLSSIGFKSNDDPELLKLFSGSAKQCTQLETPSGTYLAWKPGNGIEVWGQRGGSEQLQLFPNYTGARSRSFAITGRSTYPLNPLIGCFQTQMHVTGIDRSSRPVMLTSEIPITLNCPIYAWYKDLSLPAIVRGKITGYAQSIHILRGTNDEDYETTQPGVTLPPFGLQVLTDEQYPGAARICGQVTACREQRNPMTKDYFSTAIIHFGADELDIVISHELLDQPLRIGDTIEAMLYLCGMIDEVLETFDERAPIRRENLILQTSLASIDEPEARSRGRILTFGQRLRLQWQREHASDSVLIAVQTLDGTQLGTLSPADSFMLARRIEAGVNPSVHLVEKCGQPANSFVVRIYQPVCTTQTAAHSGRGASFEPQHSMKFNALIS